MRWACNGALSGLAYCDSAGGSWVHSLAARTLGFHLFPALWVIASA